MRIEEIQSPNNNCMFKYINVYGSEKIVLKDYKLCLWNYFRLKNIIS
jgi:hypothetical protein